MPNLPDYRSRFLFSFKPSSLPAYLERITWRKSLAQQQITVPWPYISLRRENRQTNTRYPNHEAATQSLSVVRNVLLLDQMITLLCLEQTWLCTSTMVRPKSNWMYSSTSKAITLSIRNGHNMAYITVQISSFSPYHMLHLHPEIKYSCFKSLEISSPPWLKLSPMYAVCLISARRPQKQKQDHRWIPLALMGVQSHSVLLQGLKATLELSGLLLPRQPQQKPHIRELLHQ